MTGSEGAAAGSAAASATDPGWWRHDNGRWVIEDAGRQPEITPSPAPGRAGTRPDTVVDGGHLGGLSYRATSQRGFGHQHLGIPRQDAYLLRPTPDRRWLVGCVADGVSENKLSHEAADLVCQETTVRLGRGLTALDADPAGAGFAARWPEIVAEALPWAEVVDAANHAVSRAAKTAVRERLVREGDTAELTSFETTPWTDAHARKVMSSTAVIFAVSTVAAADGGFPATVAVAAGDSGALLLDRGAWSPLTAVKNDGAPIASSAVEPLPRAVHIRPAARMLLPGQALVVVTDGLGDPLGSGSGVVGRFLATMWETPPELFAFAGQVGFYRKSFTDDRTAVAIWAHRP